MYQLNLKFPVYAVLENPDTAMAVSLLLFVHLESFISAYVRVYDFNW